MPRRRELTLGSSGKAVEGWQLLLRGVDATLAIDGSFGEATEAATIEAQRRLGVSPTGVVGPETWEAMDEALVVLAQQPPPAPPVSLGDRSEAVRRAQRRLCGAGIPCPVDGVFGPRMVSAVKTFQRRNRLVADGQISAETWAALDG